MDLEYLKQEIIPQREQEIKLGDNQGTAYPIYMVYIPEENYIEGEAVYSLPISSSGRRPEVGYILEDDFGGGEFIEGLPDDDDEEHKILTRFWVDRYKAVFLTRKAAQEYLQYQSHNLREAFIYVEYAGYDNRQMEKLLGRNER